MPHPKSTPPLLLLSCRGPQSVEVVAAAVEEGRLPETTTRSAASTVSQRADKGGQQRCLLAGLCGACCIRHHNLVLFRGVHGRQTSSAEGG